MVRAALFVAVFSVLFTACARPDTGLVVSDCGENGVTETPLSSEMVSARSVQKIGRVHGASAEEFAEVAAVATDARGRVYVLDSMSRRVVVFDSTGAFLRAFGREGEGPGEFRYPRFMDVARDTIRIFDPALWRLSVFTPEGELVRTESPERAARFGQVEELAFSTDGELLNLGYAEYQQALQDAIGTRRRAAVRGRNTIQRWDAAERRWIDLAAVPGLQVYVDMDESSIRDLPFALRPLWAPDGAGGFWHADSGEPLVRRYARDGPPLCSIRLPVERPIVGDAEREAYRAAADMADRASAERLAAIRAGREGVPVPERKPALQAILVARDGDLWVRPAHVPQTAPGRAVWYVIAPDGRPRGRVLLPDRFRPTQVADGRILGIDSDALDVDYAAVYEADL